MGNKKQITSYLLCVLSIALIVGISFPAIAIEANDTSTFGYPLKNNMIVEGFIEPQFKYGPGHRGVAFKAKPGTPVFASADGEVIFAGKVAGSLHITLSHGKDFKTTYTNLATKTVSLGDLVTKGQLLGATAYGALLRDSNTFLFTMRYRGNYVDPMKYLSGQKVVRNIRLGEIEKPFSPLSQTLSQIERKVIQQFLDSQDPIQRIKKYLKYFVGQGIKNLERLSDSAAKSYDKAIELLKKMDVFAKKLARDTLAGVKKGIKEGIKNIQELEKNLVAQLKLAFDDLKALSKEIAKLYERALEAGTQSAIWFLEVMADFVSLPSEMAINLSLLVKDIIKSTGDTTLKVLNQYATYDIPEILRAVSIPGSCLLQTCSKAIVLKCNPRITYRVRSDADGYKGSGNSLFVVAGLGTSGEVLPNGKLESTLNLPVDKLGYKKSEVQYFSYSPELSTYTPQDTYANLDIAAKAMDTQIKNFKVANPGKTLDITTHSLGGSVLTLWLAKYYDESNDLYPKIEKVVMLAPPSNGTALASGREILETQKDGKTVIEKLGMVIPRAASESVGQVGEAGYIANEMNEQKALSKVKIQTIRLSADLIVTAGTKASPYGNEIVYSSTDTWNLLFDQKQLTTNLANSHSAMINDDRVISTMQHILEGSKPPCAPVLDSLNAIGQSIGVRSVELYVARSIRTSSDLLNLNDVNKFVSTL